MCLIFLNFHIMIPKAKEPKIYNWNNQKYPFHFKNPFSSTCYERYDGPTSLWDTNDLLCGSFEDLSGINLLQKKAQLDYVNDLVSWIPSEELKSSFPLTEKHSHPNTVQINLYD